MTFFFTVIFMIMVFWRPQEWLVPWLYGWPILDVVVITATMALLMESDQGRIRFPKNAPQIYLLVGLWVAAVMSHVVHGYFAGMTYTMVEIFKICFFTLLLFCVLDSPRRLRVVALLFVVMACFMSIHAILQNLRGYGFAGRRPMWIPSINGNPPYVRSMFFGIFSDPNDLAQFLVTGIPLAFAIPKRMNAVSFLVATAVSYLLIKGYMTTHSRGGTVALVAMCSMLFCLRLPSRWMPYLVGAGLVGALILCGTKGGAMLDMSAHERVVFWGYGNRVFKSNPIFGIGCDMFWQIAHGRPAHNAFVTCYTELGIFGYWMWFGLIQAGLLSSWRSRVVLEARETEEERFLYRYVGLTLAALAGFSASAYFLSRTFIYPFFFLMAMVNAIPRIVDMEFPDVNRAPFLEAKRDVVTMGTIGAFASIVYIYLSIVLLNKSYGG